MSPTDRQLKSKLESCRRATQGCVERGGAEHLTSVPRLETSPGGGRRVTQTVSSGSASQHLRLAPDVYLRVVFRGSLFKGSHSFVLLGFLDSLKAGAPSLITSIVLLLRCAPGKHGCVWNSKGEPRTPRPQGQAYPNLSFLLHENSQGLGGRKLSFPSLGRCSI